MTQTYSDYVGRADYFSFQIEHETEQSGRSSVERLSQFAVPGTIVLPPGGDTSPYDTVYPTVRVAMWTGREFEAMEADVLGYRDWSNRREHATFVSLRFVQPFEVYTTLYCPIDPRMTAVDVHGATRAYLNTAGTHWMFAHARPGEHQDHLLAVQAAVMALFQPAVDLALVKWLEAPAGIAQTQAAARHENLLSYRSAVLAQALEQEREDHLGHYAQVGSPDEGHVHNTIRRAMSAVKVKWAATPDLVAKYRTIVDRLTPITRGLSNPHTPETRWDKAARLAAEAKKKAEDAQ